MSDVPGDYNRDGDYSAEDIDILTKGTRTSSPFEIFDLDGNGVVDQADRTFWVEQLKKTHFGDADLNGMVEFADFLQLSNSFEQMDGWAGGDFDGSGSTDFADFLVLSENFGAVSETQNVPEPNGLLLLVFGAAVGGLRSRTSRS